MSEWLISALLGVFAIASLIVLVSELRNARRAWTTSSWFILLIGWAMSLGSGWGVLTGQRTVQQDNFGDATVQFTGVSRVLSSSSSPMVILISTTAVAVALVQSHRRSVAGTGIFAMMLWGLGVMSNGYNSLPTVSYGLLATGTALMAATLLSPGRGAILGAATFGVSVAVATGFLVMINVAGATGACRASKCGPLGVLVYGVEGNENGLGLVLAISLPFAAIAFKRRTNLFMVPYLFVMTWVTGSRSALISAVAAMGILVICNPHRDGTQWTGRMKPFAVAFASGGLLLSVILPFITRDPSAYSLRGYVWLLARTEAANSWQVGLGADGWAKLRSVGLITGASVYSTHNLWLDAFYSAGIGGGFLAAILLVQIIRGGQFWAIITPITALLYAGILERPWTLTTANWLVWVVPALILSRESPVGETAPGNHLLGGTSLAKVLVEERGLTERDSVAHP